jgi:chromosome segregation ATPase
LLDIFFAIENRKIDRERQAHETTIADCHKVTKEHGAKHKDLKNQVSAREIIVVDLKQVHEEEKNKRESLKADMKQTLSATMLTGDEWAAKMITAEGQLDSYRAACEAVRQEIYSANRRAEAYADAARKNVEEHARHVTSIQELTEEIREYFFKLQTYIKACFAVPNQVQHYD